MISIPGFKRRMITYATYCRILDNYAYGTPILVTAKVDLPEKLTLPAYVSHLKKYPEDYRRLSSKLSRIKEKDSDKSKDADSIQKKLKKFRDDNPEIKEAGKHTGTKKLIVRDIKAAKKELQKTMDTIAENTGLSKKALTSAMKNKNTFQVVKAFGFSIGNMAKSVSSATGLLRKGMGKMFERVADTRVMRQIQKGTFKVDKFLDKHPTLKKIAGPAVAGALLMGWLNMSFISDMDYDMDISDMTSAAAGNFSLHDLFAGKDGVMFLTLLGVGAMGGPSFAWLGRSGKNMALALSYTAMKKSGIKADRLKEVLGKIPFDEPVNKETFGKLKDVVKDLAGKKIKSSTGDFIMTFKITADEKKFILRKRAEAVNQHVKDQKTVLKAYAKLSGIASIIEKAIKELDSNATKSLLKKGFESPLSTDYMKTLEVLREEFMGPIETLTMYARAFQRYGEED